MSSPSDQPLLRVRGITKRFVAITALSDVSLDLYAGRGNALVGENGAGKSTLIKIMTGQISPDQGQILFNGAEVSLSSPADALKLGISVVPQELSLVQDLSVAENIFLGQLPRRLMAVDFPELARRTHRIVTTLGLEVDPGRKVNELSPGSQQLVEIARGLSRNARIIILDEPTAALTESESEHLFGVLQGLKRSGHAILYVSHRMSDLPKVTEDITVLRDGHVVRTWEDTRVPEDEIVQAMVGRPVERFFSSLRQRHANPKEALRVEGLSRKGALKDISFKVSTGEILGICGLMGAGRTEVLRALFGADRADAGAVFVEGEEVRIASPRDAIRAGLALVPEERKQQGIVEMMSIADNLSLPHLRRWVAAGFIQSKSRLREISAIAQDLRVKFAAFADPIRSLSGGNQQKVVLGKWLTERPRVLLLDEPTRGIDVAAKFELYTLISHLAEQGCAIVLVSSELPEILGLCDRIMVMKEGEIVGEMDIEHASEQAIVRLAMLGADGQRTTTH
jgi:ABC-type sugar transport system ATPase subunit